MKTIETKSVDIQNKLNHSRVKQWLNERRDSISTTIEDNQLEDAPSPSFFSQYNRIILVVSAAFLIVAFFYFHQCSEYCAVKRELIDAEESHV